MNINIDFDKLKETAKDLAQTSVARAKDLTDTAIAKGKELTEIGKLKVQNASELMSQCPSPVDKKSPPMPLCVRKSVSPRLRLNTTTSASRTSRPLVTCPTRRSRTSRWTSTTLRPRITPMTAVTVAVAAAAMTSLRSNQTKPPSSKFGRGGFSLRTGVRLNQKIFP